MMKVASRMLAAIVATQMAASLAQKTIQAFTPGFVEWQGRVQRNDDDSVSFDWIGTQFSVSIDKGSYLRASFDTTNAKSSHFRLRVFVTEGGYLLPYAEIPVSHVASDYVLAAPLPSKVTVTVYNNQNTQYMASPFKLINLTTDGAFVQPELPETAATRRIEFVGDSITAATNLRRPLGDPTFGIPQAPSCADGGDYSDYPLSYMAQLCQAFGANCSTVAVGGKGLLTNCCDKGTTMPEYFLRTIGQDVASRYTFQTSGFAPDAVVINLGTNDWSGCKRYSPEGDGCGPKFQQAFTSRYVEFMKNITAWYNKPDIQFFAGVGPIRGNVTTPDYWKATQAAVAKAVASGMKAHFLDMQACTPGGGGCQGCATHPGIAGHHRMYEMSYVAVKAALGWSAVKDETLQI